MEKAPKKTQSKQFNWSSIAKQENPETVLANFFQDLFSIPEDQEETTQSERRHWVELWKNLRMDCAGGMMISPKRQKSLEEVEKWERFTGSDHSRCFESIASRMFGETGEIVVDDVLGCDLPGRLAVFVDGDGSESGGCNVLDQVQAYCWTVCDAESLGLRLAQVAPSSEIRERANSVRAEDARRCWAVSLLLQAAELSREWQREMVVVQLDVKKAFDHVDHPAASKAMKLQGVSLFSMALIAAIWSGSCMKAIFGNGDVKQSSDESRIASRSAGISSHLHDDHGTGAARLDEELDNSEIGLEALAAICCADDVVLVAVSVSAAEDRGDRKTERGRSDCWCTENTLDESPEDGGRKLCGRRTGCVVGGSFGVCGIEGVFGRECKTCDRAQISSSQQMSGEVETCSEFFMASKNAAPEHCKDYNVAGFSLNIDDFKKKNSKPCNTYTENCQEVFQPEILPLMPKEHIRNIVWLNNRGIRSRKCLLTFQCWKASFKTEVCSGKVEMVGIGGRS